MMKERILKEDQVWEELCCCCSWSEQGAGGEEEAVLLEERSVMSGGGRLGYTGCKSWSWSVALSWSQGSLVWEESGVRWEHGDQQLHGTRLGICLSSLDSESWLAQVVWSRGGTTDQAQ